ncbi:hypothetical protein ACHAXT_000368 [Thalassiosira profunda]
MCAPTNAEDPRSGLPHPSTWPHRPVYLTADDRVHVSGCEAGQSLPLGTAIELKSDIFKGIFFLRLRGIKPITDAKGQAAYFDGKKRFYQLVVQGQFKEDSLTFADIVLGDVYQRRLKYVPHGRTGRLVKRFVEAISPGIIFDIFSEQPKVLAPVGGCQTLSVDFPGEEPKDFNDIGENTELLGMFSSKKQRRKILSRPTTAETYKIDTGKIYTFEAFDHTMDFASHHQRFTGGFMVDLVPSLDGQSLSLGMYTRSNLQCMCKFLIWHERAVGKCTDP